MFCQRVRTSLDTGEDVEVAVCTACMGARERGHRVKEPGCRRKVKECAGLQSDVSGCGRSEGPVIPLKVTCVGRGTVPEKRALLESPHRALRPTLSLRRGSEGATPGHSLSIISAGLAGMTRLLGVRSCGVPRELSGYM